MSQFAAGPLPAVMPEELLYGVEGAVATGPSTAYSSSLGSSSSGMTCDAG